MPENALFFEKKLEKSQNHSYFFRYSFICQGTLARRQSQAVTCYYQSNHLNVEAIPLSNLPKDTANLPASLHTISFKC